VEGKGSSQHDLDIEGSLLGNGGGKGQRPLLPEKPGFKKDEISQPQHQGSATDRKKIEHAERMVGEAFEITRGDNIGGGPDQGRGAHQQGDIPQGKKQPLGREPGLLQKGQGDRQEEGRGSGIV
jgi:hypothetical protein